MIAIDRHRAQRVIGDGATLLLAALPWLLGAFVGVCWRVALLLWLVLLWILGAVLAGFDAGRGQRQ